MNKQNRVDPWGDLHATAARGAWLGNRGILHDQDQKIAAPWRHKFWVTCKLEFQGVRREVFSPNNYSELFFLDEATALSAGHRPCAQCRRDRFNEFKSLWSNANLEGTSAAPISQIDKQLHTERAVRGGGKVRYQTAFGLVPEGAFIETDGSALLQWQGHLHTWSVHGYSRADVVPQASTTVSVLTPASIAKVLASGFRPQVQDSARR